MRMSKGMDEGPIYCSYEIEILESDNRIDLENKLVSLCIKNLQNDLRNILNSKLILIEQNNNEASYCSKIDKSSGKIDFTKESSRKYFKSLKRLLDGPDSILKKII